MAPGRGPRASRGAARVDAPTRIVIDGRNVQRAMERGAAPGSVPTTALVARIRAAFPAGTDVELVLDGHPGGGVQGRLVRGFTVTFGRGASADEVIADRAATVLRTLGPVAAWAVVVVSDDREVRDAARRSGVRVEGTAWLIDRISRPAGPFAAGGGSPTGPGGGTAPGPRRGTTLGHGRPPRTPGSTGRRARTADGD